MFLHLLLRTTQIKAHAFHKYNAQIMELLDKLCILVVKILSIHYFKKNLRLKNKQTNVSTTVISTTCWQMCVCICVGQRTTSEVGSLPPL